MALIVGAGPTGLPLATELQAFGGRSGHRPVARPHTRESRALAVQARTIELLQMLGLGEQLAAELIQAHASSCTSKGRRLRRSPSVTLVRRILAFPFIPFVSQAEPKRF